MRLGSFVFARLLSFLPLRVINMRASGGGQTEGMKGKDGGRAPSCCLASFLFPNTHNETVSTWENCCICVSSSADAAGANGERLNGGVTTATNPSSLCLPEREVKDGERMKRRERRDEDKEERDCVRQKKRLKGAENRENNPAIFPLQFLWCCSNKKEARRQ